jgi:signal transduction histidine kinase
VPRIEIEMIGLGATRRGWDGWPQHHVDLPPPTVVAVRDNGIGIAERDAEKIFEVFRRLHRDEDFGGGSGAGLPIARRIAERHGGALWVEPNEPLGSVFLVALAAADAPAVEEER